MRREFIYLLFILYYQFSGNIVSGKSLFKKEYVAITNHQQFHDTSFVKPCDSLLGKLPDIFFKKQSSSLNKEARQVLNFIAERMRFSAGCIVAVWGNCYSSEKEQQISWDRVNNVIRYLEKKMNIPSDRFIFYYGVDNTDCQTVSLRAAAPDETGPSWLPPPHPNLKNH